MAEVKGRVHMPASGARVFSLVLKKKEKKKKTLLAEVSLGEKMNGSSERETKAKEKAHVGISTTL